MLLLSRECHPLLTPGCRLHAAISPAVPQSSAQPAVVILQDSIVQLCTVTGTSPRGGAVTASIASVLLSNSTLANNRVTVLPLGGGPFDRVARLVPFGSGAGGGLFGVNATVTLTRRSMLSGNRANYAGGLALFSSGSSLTIDGASVLAGNQALSGTGGAAHLDGIASFSALNGSAFLQNTAATMGGAVYTTGVRSVVIRGIRASSNA